MPFPLTLMPTQHIYFTDELYEKLKKEENISKLVSELLEEHYKKSELTEEEIIQDVKDKIARKKIEENEKMLNELNKRLKEAEDARTEPFKKLAQTYFYSKEGQAEYVKGRNEELWQDIMEFRKIKAKEFEMLTDEEFEKVKKRYEERKKEKEDDGENRSA